MMGAGFHIVALPEAPRAEAILTPAMARAGMRFYWPDDPGRILPPRQTHCEHGLSRVADCHRCDWEIRYNRTAVNAAHMRDSDGGKR